MTDTEHVRDLEVIEGLRKWASNEHPIHALTGRTLADVRASLSTLDGDFRVEEHGQEVLVYRAPIKGRLPSGPEVEVSEDGTFVIGGILHWNIEDYRRTLETKITQVLDGTDATESIEWLCQDVELDGVYSEAILR